MDDEEFIRELGKELLEENGYRVLQAGDGLQAVEIFRRQWKEIDLVILDVIMPKLDGGQAYLEMKRIDNNVKVLFYTGFLSDPAIAPLLTEENVWALQKPFRHEQLLATVKMILGDAQGNQNLL